jgi:hypothetical protein
MPVATSADGTAIAYERTGSGTAFVLVDVAMCYRAAGLMQPLPTLLQDRFTDFLPMKPWCPGQGGIGSLARSCAAAECSSLCLDIELIPHQ